MISARSWSVALEPSRRPPVVGALVHPLDWAAVPPLAATPLRLIDWSFHNVTRPGLPTGEVKAIDERLVTWSPGSK